MVDDSTRTAPEVMSFQRLTRTPPSFHGCSSKLTVAQSYRRSAGCMCLFEIGDLPRAHESTKRFSRP